MFIFPAIIVVAAVLFIYYKVAILKSKDELIQRYFNAKARICLGTFVFVFGINQYIFYKTQLSLFIWDCFPYSRRASILQRSYGGKTLSQ